MRKASKPCKWAVPTNASRLVEVMPDREIEIEGVRRKSPRRVFAETVKKEAPGVLGTEFSKQPGVKGEASAEHVAIVGNSPSIRDIVKQRSGLPISM